MVTLVLRAKSAVGLFGDSSAAEADWVARSTAADVVWAHDFRYENEVKAFRYSGGYGNDPENTQNQLCTWKGIEPGKNYGVLVMGQAGDGVDRQTPGWWRPMSAIQAGDNGLPYDDLGASGTLPRRAWNSASTTTNFTWRYGYYGHVDYHTGGTFGPDWQGRTNVWDGDEFYVQFRVRNTGDRWFGYNGDASGEEPGNGGSTRNPSGKLFFVDTTSVTSESEIVVYSGGPDPGYFHSTYPFRQYTATGNQAVLLTSPQGGGDGASMQGGGPYESTCKIGFDTNPENMCWEWPRDEQWVTVLMRVKPGHDNQTEWNTDPKPPVSTWANRDTILETWVAREGETSYTKVFENTALAFVFGDRNGTGGVYDTHPPGFNSICPSNYMNGYKAILGHGWDHEYTQIIFSKGPIPCPQAW
jgi:hypothetical protein